MKITSNPQAAGPHLDRLNSPGRGGSAHGTAPVAGGEDTASLRTGQETISRLKTQLNAAPEVRSQRVAQLRDALANGTYNVNPTQVAQAMITDLTGRQG